MASRPPRVVWTGEARSSFRDLSYPIRSEIIEKIEIIRLHPRMYQVEGRGRWAGLRRFMAHSWKVYYAFWDSENTIYVEAILHARSESF